MNKIKQIIAASLLSVSVTAAPLLVPAVAGATTPPQQKQTTTQEPASPSPSQEIKKGVDDSGGTGQSDNIGSNVKKVVNVLLYVLGAIAVLMIVIGGFRYTLSGGDSSSTKAAKDTIMYAVVGLVVAIMAYSIVNFVLISF